jgi:hypothetical protein
MQQKAEDCPQVPLQANQEVIPQVDKPFPDKGWCETVKVSSINNEKNNSW